MYPISLGGDITVTIRSMVCGSINKKIKSSFALSVKERKKERNYSHKMVWSKNQRAVTLVAGEGRPAGQHKQQQHNKPLIK